MNPMQDSRHRGFTLVELLVVIGIIALLISILLPSLNRARESAKMVQCASNMRQLATSMVHYSIDYRGRFPTNFTQVNSAGIAMFWFDAEQIGRYLPDDVKLGSGSIGGGVFVCPSDIQNAKRSYAMNVWASGDLEVAAAPSGPAPFLTAPDPTTGLPRGRQFQSNVTDSSKMLLIGEKWSQIEVKGTANDGFYANSTVGYAGVTPARRFVQATPVSTAHYGAPAAIELDYTRHSRERVDDLTAPQTKGQCNYAFSDGHVSMFGVNKLALIGDPADPKSWVSTREVKWSPLDDRLIEYELTTNP